MKIGYIIPEFPGQTHIWMWREIVHMREWGAPLTIFSTRRPPAEARARHGFADAAEVQTIYLWPAPVATALASVAWAIARHPLGFFHAIWISLTLPINKRPAARSLLPLLVPACILARHCSRLGIEHLHSHTCSNSAILCMMVKRIAHVPFSMTLNANIEWWGGAMAQKFADATFTVAITQWLLDQMRRDYPNLKPDQAILGRIGVDTRAWVPSPFTPRSPSDPIRLITVGRLHSSKGHDVLLRAVRLLVDSGKPALLRIAGAGPERPALEALVGELKLADRVTFLGSLPEDKVIEELRQADVFVLASHAEPLGVVYMEAMAMAVPTIGTAAGGVAEIIDSRRDGILVPPGDAAAIAGAIEALMSDNQYRQQIGLAGRDTIERKFDSRIGAATLYQRLMGKPPATT